MFGSLFDLLSDLLYGSQGSICWRRICLAEFSVLLVMVVCVGEIVGVILVSRQL